MKKKDKIPSHLDYCLFQFVHRFFFYCLGAMHFFPKLDIGSLKLGDYLGIYDQICFLMLHLSNLTPLFLLETHLYVTEFLEYSNWSNIFSDRFCLHLAGINSNVNYKACFNNFRRTEQLFK